MNTHHQTQNDKANVNKALSFLIQVFVGTILLVKATDSVLGIFPVENYTPEAQALIGSFESLPLMKSAIFGLHVVLGTLLLFNLFVPFTLFMTLPLMGFAFLFELTYGTYLLPQVLTTVALVATAGLFLMNGRFFKTFIQVQLMSNIMDPKTATPEILDLTDIKEKDPEKYKKIKALKPFQV